MNTSSSSSSSSKALILLLIVTVTLLGTSARGIPSRPSSGPSTMVLGNVDSSPSSSSSLLLSPPELRKNRWYSRDQHRGVFGRKEVKNCLPKGFRHTSAPSRYVNYQPLGSCA
ncbi:hypothetical protein LINPERHAP2_LOCUS29803 [Linum perenne]